jgi:hypothetical protein
MPDDIWCITNADTGETHCMFTPECPIAQALISLEIESRLIAKSGSVIREYLQSLIESGKVASA